MKEKEIIAFLEQNISPLEDSVYGKLYRASVYLKSNVFIPNVIFLSSKLYFDLYKRRIETNGKHEDMTKLFFIKKNIISSNDIERIEKCNNAIPIEKLKQIKGETLPSWTGFVLKMKDGKLFNFGTTFSTYFFDFPENYSSDDICEVINHSYIDESNEIQEYRKHSLNDLNNIKIYHQIDDYFDCYLDEL